MLEEAVLRGVDRSWAFLFSQVNCTAMEIEQAVFSEKRYLSPSISFTGMSFWRNRRKRRLRWIALSARLTFLGKKAPDFVRRVYQHNKLFALTEIKQRYPDYTEVMLLQDIKVKSPKQKRKKHKPIVDLRRCQLEKLATKLRFHDLTEQEYHAVCCKMAMLQNAHNHRLPIPLTVKLDGDTLVYSFGWKTREQVVKSFVDLANAAGMTHEQLKIKYHELISSAYRY